MMVRHVISCSLTCILLQVTARGQDDDLAFLHYRESFETNLAPGEKGDLGNTGWDLGNSTLENAGIWHPAAGDFNQVTPLAPTADGNQVLFIDDLDGAMDNTFVAVNTGIVLEDDGTYRITAATGHPLGGIGDQSIQAWVQPEPRDGGIDRRGFVGQAFTTHQWQEAEAGEWIDNSLELTAFADALAFNPATGLSDIPIVGSELIILVTNFNTDCCGIPGGQPGVVVWDDFRVHSDVALSATIPGDYNADTLVDAVDINLLSEAVREGSMDPLFDANADGHVDSADRSFWVINIKNTWFGDSNLDGLFNSSDLVSAFAVSKYESGVDAYWEDGDWSGDERFTSSDLILAFQDGGFEQGRRPQAAQPVPEPTACFLAVLTLTTMALQRRWFASNEDGCPASTDTGDTPCRSESAASRC